jgi:hypothetical protein
MLKLTICTMSLEWVSYIFVFQTCWNWHFLPWHIQDILKLLLVADKVEVCILGLIVVVSAVSICNASPNRTWSPNYSVLVNSEHSRPAIQKRAEPAVVGLPSLLDVPWYWQSCKVRFSWRTTHNYTAEKKLEARGGGKTHVPERGGGIMT